MTSLLPYIKQIFLFHNDAPLIFTQLYFWIFYAVVLLFYSILYKNKPVRSTYLFLISLFFYYKTSGFFFFLLIFSTLVDFFIGKGIYNSKRDFVKKLLIALSVTVNLLVLSYFKYAYFFVDSVNYLLGTHFQVSNILSAYANDLFGTHFDIDKILLPVGISFYTFQTISYSIDIYRKQIKPLNNILDFGFFVSFFPQLVAGPIVRAGDFVNQIKEDFHLTKEEFGIAVFMILNGLIKKMVLADFIALNLIDRVFANPLSYSGVEGTLALIGYSLQVYADFSGYTDIAIGVALLMGFRLPQNFNSPYKAQNTGEFWKRWHMSLSSWLKDYLYIPMGGNRKGTFFTYLSISILLIIIAMLAHNWILLPIFAGSSLVLFIIARFSPSFKRWINTNINILTTMLLGGLWHGASFKFILWGGLNGIGIIIYKLWKRISPYEGKNNPLIVVWRIALTFSFITFTRIWFRSDNMQKANDLIHQIINHFDWHMIPSVFIGYKTVLFVMLGGFIIHWLSVKTKNWYRQTFVDLHYSLKILIVVVVVFLIYQTRTVGLQPFIYFQF
jgi:D-alanyl-lipoteichoic acid acyltransferase DltB (MBOAT superfamily)